MTDTDASALTLPAAHLFWREMIETGAVSPETKVAVEAEAAEHGITLDHGADPCVAAVARLAADRAEYPASQVLTELAVLNETDAVIGMSHHTRRDAPHLDRLKSAYLDDGVPASLIAEAERLAAVIGAPGGPGYVRRALRLAHRVRAVNARLRRYSGLSRTLDTITHRGPTRVEALFGHLIGAQLAAQLAARSDAHAAGRLPPSGPDPPPPLDSPELAPVLRTGPPVSPLVRPRQAAPRAGSTLRKVTVSRAA